jgi:hypothetical protein
MVPAQSPDVGAADANFLPLQDIGSALTPMAAVQIVALFPSGHDSEDEMSNTLLKKRISSWARGLHERLCLRRIMRITSSP